MLAALAKLSFCFEFIFPTTSVPWETKLTVWKGFSSLKLDELRNVDMLPSSQDPNE